MDEATPLHASLQVDPSFDFWSFITVGEATPPDGAQPHMSQTTAATSMIDKIELLWKQNQERLRSLRQSNSSAEGPTMHRFNDFPLEIREMIWGHTLPRRLLGNQDIVQGYLIPKDLHVPPLGHVCRESRRFAASKNHSKALPGADDGLKADAKPLHRARIRNPTPPSWAWFSPCTDALMVSAEGFNRQPHDANHVLARAAEHIIVEDLSFWEGYYEVSQGEYDNGLYDQGVDVLLNDLTSWVQKVYATPYSESEDYARAHAPICSLRTVDFSMRQVTHVRPDSPPGFLRRLFGEATFRVVDLRDMGDFLRVLGHELLRGMHQDLFFRCSGELENAFDIYKSVAEKFFQHLRPVLLKALVSACFEASKKDSRDGQGSLPEPFKPGGSKLNMEVTWVKGLDERLRVRPVHVFILGKNGLESSDEED